MNSNGRPSVSSAPNLPRSRPPAWTGLLAGTTVLVMVLGLLPAALAIPGSGAAGVPHASTSPLAQTISPPSAALSPATAPPLHGVVFNAPGPRPASWGPSGSPPGWEALQTRTATSGANGWGGGGAGNSTAGNWDNRFCAGVWPGFPTLWGNPQGTYASGCYGHDEPGIQFYSTLPGSGGNVTWNVTLPTDRSPTLNQSNLYSAIWFGMTLSDPAAWMDQCFLELQFYPDQTFYNPGPLYPNYTVNGAWIGAAVAWQIEASNGYENPCFYEPLYLNGNPGPAFLNMTQGDNIVVSMTGFTTSTVGEKLVIRDQTNGQSSTIVLYNSTGKFPLNPAYSTNSYQGGLEWTPGGEYPVGFAFETGHAGNPNWPANNSYGGCSPGLKSTPADPGAPCPSYDPGSWANDTLSPWKIQVPMFFNAGHSTKAAQVAFTQDFGGIDLESQIGGTGCANAAGSAWCSYPWYSYSCAFSSFEFGATDYATFSADFGKYNEYAQQFQENALGFGFYPPTNFSVPACSSPSYTVTVGTSGTGAGAAYFLSHAYSTPTGVTGVGTGTYSLNAINSGSGKFDHWVTSGAVTVATKTSAYTSLTVSGAGTATAVFSATPRMTKVTLADSPSGTIGVDPALTFQGSYSGTGNPIGTFASGAKLSLSPGTYSVQAYPAVGYVFASWSGSTGLTVAAADLPFTWVVVTGGAATATLTAHYTKAGSVSVPFYVYAIGNGSVTVLGHTVTGTTSATGIGTFHPSVGSYAITATPGTGANSVTWYFGPAAIMTNFSLSTEITVEAGASFVEAVFGEQATLTLADSPAAAGAITFVPPFGASSPHASGSTETLAPGTYTLVADPFSGMSFVGWTVSGGATLTAPGQLVTNVTVTTSATVTAAFSSASKTAGVKFVPSPSGEGAVQLDGMTVYSTSTTNSSLSVGLHTVSAIPAPGFLFSHWTGGSKVLLVGASTGTDQVINVTGTGSSLTAAFTAGTYPFTFVAVQPSSSNITVKVNGVILHSGDTEYLPSGHYSAPFAGGGIGSNGGWTATSNITFTNRTTTSASFIVAGSGTLYLILVSNGTGGPTMGPHTAPSLAVPSAPIGVPFTAWYRPT